MDSLGYSTKIENNVVTLTSGDLSPDEINFRFQYPANYRTDDGHFVRSTFEVIVDSWFYHHGIPHAYEKIVPGCGMTCDFYIKSKNGDEYYVEVWGMKTPGYLNRKAQKRKLYKSNQFKVISIEPEHVSSIDDFLSELKHKLYL